MKKLVIFGNGDIAELAHYYFANDTHYEVVSFTVDEEYLDSESFSGLPNVPFNQLSQLMPPENHEIFIAIGYANMNQLRASKLIQAKQWGYEAASYVSSRATIFGNFKCGENCFILEDNTVQPYASIGDNVTLWSGNHIGHHAVIGDNCFITSHVVVSGGVEIKNNCFLGVNATIRDHLTLGSYSLVTAGSLVLKDTEDYSIYDGSPAKKRKLKSTDLKKI